MVVMVLEVMVVVERVDLKTNSLFNFLAGRIASSNSFHPGSFAGTVPEILVIEILVTASNNKQISVTLQLMTARDKKEKKKQLQKL